MATATDDKLHVISHLIARAEMAPDDEPIPPTTTLGLITGVVNGSILYDIETDTVTKLSV